MKKIAVYNSSSNLNAGGGLVYALSVAQALSKLNYQVTLYLSNDIDISKLKVNYGIKNLELVSVLSGGKPLFDQIKIAILEYFKFDAIIFHSNNPPRINFIRNSFILCDFPQKKMLNKKDRIRLLFWRKVLVNSNFTKKYLQEYWRTTADVLYPPISQKNITNKDQLQIIAIGRFHQGGRSKRHDLIIDAFINLVNKTKQPWQLHLVGFVQDYNYVKKLKEKSLGYDIIFHENLIGERKDELLSRCGIYIHACGYDVNEEEKPELTEHFGISLIEAMAFDCVPLVIPKGGPKEIVTSGKNGFYWESLEELVNRIIFLDKNKDLFENMGFNAEKRAQDFYSEPFQKRLLEIIPPN